MPLLWPMKYLGWVCSLLFVGLSAGEVAAQQVVPPLKKEFLDSTFTVLPSAAGARYRRETEYTDSTAGEVRDYYLSGQLQSKGTYENIRLDIANGAFDTWHANGQLESHSEMSHGKPTGEARMYYPTGQLMSRVHYAAGNLLDSQCFDAEGKPMECPIVREVMPVYPDGDGSQQAIIQAVARNFKYPRSALKAHTTGRVVVGFDVTAEGRVANARILESLSPAIDAEAIQAVRKLKRFKPGTQNDKPVKVKFTVPIQLSIK